MEDTSGKRAGLSEFAGDRIRSGCEDIPGLVPRLLSFCLVPFRCPVPAQLSCPLGKLNLKMWRAGCFQKGMSSFKSTDEKLALPVELGGSEGSRENRPPDADRHISISLAHELNNVLAVVQGHSERLFVKHQEDAALAPSLQKIANAARRAAELVRSAPKLDLNPPAA